jgi:hypothetical protein
MGTSTFSIATELLLLRLKIVFYYNLLLLKNLNCFEETAESCGLQDNVFETQRKLLLIRALCCPLTILPLHPSVQEAKLSDDSKVLFLGKRKL